MGNNAGSIEKIMDSCLKSRNIRRGYEYVAGCEEYDCAVNSMLEIWVLEESHEEKTILWNVFSYNDLLLKWQLIDRIMRLILKKVDLTPQIHQYVEAEISVWGILVWVLTLCQDLHQQTIALDILILYWKNHNYENVQVLEDVYMKNISNILSKAISNDEFYLAKKYVMKLKEGNERTELNRKIEWGLREIEVKAEGRLYTPTCMEKIGENYIIVDCWHDRVIYSDQLIDIKEWNVFDKNLWNPHSICEGGGIYATESTEHGSVCFYRKGRGKFVKIDDIFLGKRPHRVVYDESRDVFWVLGGETQELYGIRLANGHMEQFHKQRIEELHSSYVRSMRIIHDKFYIVSGPGAILELAFLDDRFIVENMYAVPLKYCGMNDIIFFDGYFWISVYSTNKEIMPALIKIRSLEDFATENYEDLYGLLGMKGIPYYFSWIDGKLCIPEIDTYNRIVLYDVNDGELNASRILYDFGRAEKEDITYKNRHLYENNEVDWSLWQ